MPVSTGIGMVVFCGTMSALVDRKKPPAALSRVKLPYHMSCRQEHALLYELSDGRFRIMQAGALAPLMIGYEYALAERALADYLQMLNLPRLRITHAVIYEPRKRQENRTYRRLRIDQRFASYMIRDLDLDGERLLLMDDQYVFASPELKRRLARSPFRYLRFSAGLNDFAGPRGVSRV